MTGLESHHLSPEERSLVAREGFPIFAEVLPLIVALHKENLAPSLVNRPSLPVGEEQVQAGGLHHRRWHYPAGSFHNDTRPVMPPGAPYELNRHQQPGAYGSGSPYYGMESQTTPYYPNPSSYQQPGIYNGSGSPYYGMESQTTPYYPNPYSYQQPGIYNGSGSPYYGMESQTAPDYPAPYSYQQPAIYNGGAFPYTTRSAVPRHHYQRPGQFYGAPVYSTGSQEYQAAPVYHNRHQRPGAYSGTPAYGWGAGATVPSVPMGAGEQAKETDIADYLKGHYHLNTVEIAGILGNMKQESDFKTDSYKRSEGAFGLCQWEGSRLVALERYAQEQRRPITDLHLQLDFMMHELYTSERTAFTHLQQSRTPTQAALVFAHDFERCGVLGPRQGNAVAAYAMLERYQSGATV